MPTVRTLPPLLVVPLSSETFVDPAPSSSRPQESESVSAVSGRWIHNHQGFFWVLLQNVPNDPDEASPDLVAALRRAHPSLTGSQPWDEALHRDLDTAVSSVSVPRGSEGPAYSRLLRDQELTVALLIKRGARSSPATLTLAAQSANPRLVQRVLAARRTDVSWDLPNVSTSFGHPHPHPLINVAMTNHWSTVPETIDLLLEAGVPMDLKDANDERTALHWAATYRNTPALHALLERGADPNEPDARGHTSVHIAAAQNSPSALQVLLDAGGDPCRRAIPVQSGPKQFDHGLSVPMLSRAQPEDAERSETMCADTPLLQAAARGASETLALLIKTGLEPFPLLAPSPSYPVGARDQRAMTLALAYQKSHETSSSPRVQKEAAQNVRLLEQHVLRHDLTEIVKESTARLEHRSRSRL